MTKLMAPLLLLLLAGCGAPRYFTMEVEDQAALTRMDQYHAKPADVQFTRPANWELKDAEWQEMLDNGNQAYIRKLGEENKPVVYRAGPDAKPESGGVIDLKITHISRGHYTFFTWQPAIIDAIVTITDVKSGNVIFKGSTRSPTPERSDWKGWDLAGDDGRISGAYHELGRRLHDTLHWYYSQKK